MKHLYILITLLFCSLTLPVSAEVSFNVMTPGRVTEGSKFAVTFRLKNADGSSLKAPQISGCKLLYGPVESRSQSYQVINGQVSSSSSTDFTFYYRADKAGTYTIGEATIIADGKKMTSRQATITVAPAPAGNSGNPSSAPVNIDDIDTQSSDRRVSSDDVFVRIILNRSSAFEQEAIECTIKLYTKYSISSFFPTKQPSFDGFLIQELDVTPALNEVESYKGQNYMTAILKKCIIFPQKSGKLTINSGNYDLKVVQYDNVNMGLFSVRNPTEREIKVSSNSASINIQPLPQPQPEGFTGAVGSFKIDSRLVGDNFRTNDPATLIYTITGTGNIKYIKEPTIDFPSEFEQYTPQSDIVANPTGGTVTGKMTIEYTFVPQSVGNFKIGSHKFVYFDPGKREYVTLTTPTYDIKVAKGIAPSTSDATRQDIAAKNTDILHIKLGDKHLSKSHILVYETGWFWSLWVLAVIVMVLAICLYGRHVKKSADLVGMRTAKANKVARQRLKLTKKLLETNQTDKFYEEMLRAVWGYLSDKLSIPVSQLNRDNIAAELTSNYGASTELCDSFIDVLDRCEMARYSPAGSKEEIDDLYNKATSAINAMENLKKIKR